MGPLCFQKVIFYVVYLFTSGFMRFFYGISTGFLRDLYEVYCLGTNSCNYVETPVFQEKPYVFRKQLLYLGRISCLSEESFVFRKKTSSSGESMASAWAPIRDQVERVE